MIAKMVKMDLIFKNVQSKNAQCTKNNPLSKLPVEWKPNYNITKKNTFKKHRHWMVKDTLKDIFNEARQSTKSLTAVAFCLHPTELQAWCWKTDGAHLNFPAGKVCHSTVGVKACTLHMPGIHILRLPVKAPCRLLCSYDPEKLHALEGGWFS